MGHFTNGLRSNPDKPFIHEVCREKCNSAIGRDGIISVYYCETCPGVQLRLPRNSLKLCYVYLYPGWCPTVNTDVDETNPVRTLTAVLMPKL